MAEEIVTGGCLCGAVRYKFDKAAVQSASHCHCTDCQKCTGSGKATIVFLPKQALSVAGELRMFSVTGSEGSHVNREFCPNCGSPLISHVDEMPDMRFVKAGSLDDSSWVRVESNYWSHSARAWSPVDEGIKTFPRNPG